MIKTICPSGVNGTLKAPASKSYAQRAIAAALLADGESVLQNIDLCDDISAAAGVAEALGAKVSVEGGNYVIKGGMSPVSGTLDIGESGLSTRLFTPIAAICGRVMTITGHGSILSRPLSMMEQPLRELGARISSNGGYLPIEIEGPLKGGDIEVDGSLSSQFISGLLFALPLAQNNSTLRVKSLNSRPYIDMTLEVIRAFGVEIVNRDYEEFFIKGGQCYRPARYNVEGDWSGASCLLVAGAVAGKITVANLNPESLQADRAIVDALKMTGAIVTQNGNNITVEKNSLRGFEFDATHCPDLFPALAVLAANCQGESVITGTKRLANKESDRAKTITETFARLSIDIDISRENTMIIKGGPIQGGIVNSYNDHRIAMAAAVAALTSSAEVVIEDAQAVNKSYPGFWNDLSAITGK